jgi:GMP synthase PP-ATPase subunit
MEQLRLNSTETERQIGHQIIAEELGDSFRLNFDLYPHNKGLKGDRGVYGETVEIELLNGNPIKFFTDNQELLAKVSSRITNELPAVTKVSFFIAERER